MISTEKLCKLGALSLGLLVVLIGARSFAGFLSMYHNCGSDAAVGQTCIYGPGSGCLGATASEGVCVEGANNSFTGSTAGGRCISPPRAMDAPGTHSTKWCDVGIGSKYRAAVGQDVPKALRSCIDSCFCNYSNDLVGQKQLLETCVQNCSNNPLFNSAYSAAVNACLASPNLNALSRIVGENVSNYDDADVKLAKQPKQSLQTDASCLSALYQCVDGGSKTNAECQRDYDKCVDALRPENRKKIVANKLIDDAKQRVGQRNDFCRRFPLQSKPDENVLSCHSRQSIQQSVKWG